MVWELRAADPCIGASSLFEWKGCGFASRDLRKEVKIKYVFSRHEVVCSSFYTSLSFFFISLFVDGVICLLSMCLLPNVVLLPVGWF